MSDWFTLSNVLKQVGALVLLLSNFCLEYAIRKVEGDEEGLRLNVTNQLLFCADDVNLLRGNTHTKKKSQKFC
jgi:hypothetical protein